MLKSLSTQFAATLFFGPLGLAYSSVAAAVFVTLLFAVLYFTELGLAAALLIWPIAIIAGLVFVKLHNDQIRSSGSSLLLGPGESEGVVGMVNSWGRGIAVLSLIGVVAYLALWYSPSGTSEKIGRMVDVSPVENAVAGSDVSTETNSGSSVIDPDAPLDTQIVTTSLKETESSFSETTFDQQEATSVVSDASSEPGADETIVYVDSAVVNLRDGPGTNYKVLVQVQRGDELREIDRAGGWVSVIASKSGTSGWILGRLVSSQQ